MQHFFVSTPKRSLNELPKIEINALPAFFTTEQLNQIIKYLVDNKFDCKDRIERFFSVSDFNELTIMNVITKLTARFKTQMKSKFISLYEFLDFIIVSVLGFERVS